MDSGYITLFAPTREQTKEHRCLLLLHFSTRSILWIFFPITQACQCPTLALSDSLVCCYKCILTEILSLHHRLSFSLCIFLLIDSENA